MAITLYAQPETFSDLVLGYVKSSDIGYPFKEVTLTKTATLKPGSILTADNVEAANATGGVASVFVRADILGGLESLAVGEQFTAVTAVRAATLNKFKLVYSDGTAIDEAGVLALEAKGLSITPHVLQPIN